MKKFTLLSVTLVFLSGNYSCGMESDSYGKEIEQDNVLFYPPTKPYKFITGALSYEAFTDKMETGFQLEKIHGKKEVFKINGFDVHTLGRDSDVVQLSSVNGRGEETRSEYSVNKNFRCNNYVSDYNIDDEEGDKDCGYNSHFVEYCKNCRERRPLRFLQWKLECEEYKDIGSASLIMFWNKYNELTNHVYFKNGSISVESLKKYIDLKKHVLWVKPIPRSNSYLQQVVKSYLPSLFGDPIACGWRINTEEDGIVDLENPWETGNSLLKLIFLYNQNAIENEDLNDKLESLLKNYDFVGAFEGTECLTNRNNKLKLKSNEKIIESLWRNGMRSLHKSERDKLLEFAENHLNLVND